MREINPILFPPPFSCPLLSRLYTRLFPSRAKIRDGLTVRPCFSSGEQICVRACVRACMKKARARVRLACRYPCRTLSLFQFDVILFLCHRVLRMRSLQRKKPKESVTGSTLSSVGIGLHGRLPRGAQMGKLPPRSRICLYRSTDVRTYGNPVLTEIRALDLQY